MRKGIKRADAEPVAVASKTDASPPKKTKSRAKTTKETAPVGEARLPRAAKTKSLAAILNNNNVEAPGETKKGTARHHPALQKSNSTEDMSPQSMAVMKKSQSAEDIFPEESKAPVKRGGKGVVAEKPAKKAATTTAKAKLKKFVSKDAEEANAVDVKEPEDEEVKENEEVDAALPAKKTTRKAAAKKTVAAETKEAPKKLPAAKKTATRGRGKAAAPVEEDEEIEKTEDAMEEVKPAKGRKGKTVAEAKPPPKKQQQRGKKTVQSVDPEDKGAEADVEADDETTEDVADTEEEPVEEVKPVAKGKKGKARAAPAKRPRGKKASPPVVEDLEEKDDAEEKENGKKNEEDEEEKEDEKKDEDANSNDDDKTEEKETKSPVHNGKWALATDNDSSQSE